MLSYSTYLGGNGSDLAWGFDVDAAGNAYAAGFSDSTDFPTASPIQGTFGGGLADRFVAKIDTQGTLLYSPYLGGLDRDFSRGVSVDSAGNMYVKGETTDNKFPGNERFPIHPEGC